MSLYDVLFRVDEEDTKAGSFITKDGRVIFVGGLGSGGGSSGGGSSGGVAVSEVFSGTSADLTDADIVSMKTTAGLIKKGFGVSDPQIVDQLGREAADQLNQAGIFEGSVYASHYNGMTPVGDDKFGSVPFAGVAGGSGESNRAFSKAVSWLRDAGWNATYVNNDDYSGIIVNSL